MRNSLFIFFMSFILPVSAQNIVNVNAGIEVQELKFVPQLQFEHQIGTEPEDSCFKRVYGFGDTSLNLKHVHYRNDYCMLGLQRETLLDTLIIGNTVFDAQSEIVRLVSGFAKDYYKHHPPNVLVTRLFKIIAFEELYYVICFWDTNTLSGSIPDEFIILYSKKDDKVLLFEGQAEITNYEVLFGDFDGDGGVEFISWDYGTPKAISLDGIHKEYKYLQLEVDEAEHFSKYILQITNKKNGQKISKELNISNTFPKKDYRN